MPSLRNLPSVLLIYISPKHESTSRLLTVLGHRLKHSLKVEDDPPMRKFLSIN